MVSQQKTHGKNQTIMQFKQVFDEFINGNFDTAHQNAGMLGYEVVKYTNTDIGLSDVHYILRETP